MTLKVHTCHLYWLLDVNMSYSRCFLVIFDSTGSSQRDLDAQKSKLNISRCRLSKVSARLRVQIKSRKCMKLPLPSPRDVSSLSPHFSKLQLRLQDVEMRNSFISVLLETSQLPPPAKRLLPSSIRCWIAYLNEGKGVVNHLYVAVGRCLMPHFVCDVLSL